MDGNVVFMIREGITGKVLETTASGTDSASIFITAGSIAEAMELLPEAEAAAAEAMANWKPEKKAEDEKPQEHYQAYTATSIEEMDEIAKAYEETAAGQKLLKSIEQAKKFIFKHRKSDLKYAQIDYLANKHHNNFINGSFELAALYFRRGYNLGKAEAKKKK